MARHRARARPTPAGSAPSPADRRRGGDPDTTRLDLAAIALAVARGAPPGAAVAAPPRRRTVGLPARAAGVLALLGAIAGAGVAAAGGGTMLTASEAPDTGALVAADAAPARAPAPAESSDEPGSGTDAPSEPAPSGVDTEDTDADGPAPTTPGDDRDTIWSADFAAAGLDRFRDAPVTDGSPTVSGGTLALGPESPALEPDVADFGEGDDYHVGFTVRPDEISGDAGTVTRFVDEVTGGTPLEVGIRDGWYVLDGDGARERVIGRAVPGEWTHLRLRVRFSSIGGSVSAWQDGSAAIDDWTPPAGTLGPGGSSHLVLGADTRTARLSFADYAVGSSAAAVAGGVRPGTTTGAVPGR